MIQLYRVTKYYEGVPALRDISFSVEKGEFVFVTGPSGAGKSTLLKILFCAERADEGQIIIQGMNAHRLGPSGIPFLRRNIGFVFQDYKLLPHKTIYENIALALKVVGTPYGEIERRTYQVLKKVSMEKKLHLTPPKLSGGEQQRVAVARALVNEPQVLLADEPTGSLDPQSGREVFDLFREVNMKGTTVLVATHDWETVRKMQRRIITMERGKVTDDGKRHVQWSLSLRPPADEGPDGAALRRGEP
ncbi:MAG: cell division ATP-binding protein FtsE [Nitrospirae bacterium GWC2_56_14]|nr:MAG: cell division ATP-binding protein FtsE [Nitrospirae bacterium GWC2_56_14]